MATSKTTITTRAHCRSLPPVGAVLLCQEQPSAAAHPITVERHLGRYFIAAGHRFHVFDDWRAGTTRPTWQTAAARVELLTAEEAAELNIDRGFDYDALLGPPAALLPPGRGHIYVIGIDPNGGADDEWVTTVLDVTTRPG